MSNKSNEEIAADLLIAVMHAKSWQPNGATAKDRAESIGQAFTIVLRSVRKAYQED